MTEADLNGAARGLFVTISAGARLGHYEICSQIGAGGMGATTRWPYSWECQMKHE